MATNSAFAADFDEADFRTNIRETMKMGMPEDDALKLTWWWERDDTYSPDDTAGDPYNWLDDPVTDDPGNPDLPDTGDPQSLIVDYTFEFSSRPAGSSTTIIGEIDNTLLTATLFDVDYQKIKTADYATIGDTRYRIKFVPPPNPLFGVTMWDVIIEAEDEGTHDES